MPPQKPQLRASLLDRLIDDEPKHRREARPLRTQLSGDLRASVRRDLAWLLNTRTSLDGPEFDRRTLTVIDYGIPDFGGMSPESASDRKQMARRIARAINAFEPRLQAVRVTIAPRMRGARALTARIEAMLTIERLSEPVAFDTIFHQTTGTVEIHDGLDG